MTDKVKEEDYQVEIPDIILKFAADVMGQEHTVVDFDYRNVYIDSHDGEYNIRTWNISESRIEWTLFKMVDNGDGTGYGKDLRSGVYQVNLLEAK